MKSRLEKPEREAIGIRVREVRHFSRLEQTELAEQAGLSQAIISQYEKGLTEVSLSFIKFLAETFGVSGDWLIFGTGNSPSERVNKEIKIRYPDGFGEKGSKKGQRRGFCGVPLADPKSVWNPGRLHADSILEWEIIPAKEMHGRKDLIALDILAPWVKNMRPPFRAGARIIIDRDDKEMRPDGYYAVNTMPEKQPPKDSAVNAIRRLNRSGQRIWFIEDKPQQSFEFIDLKASERIHRIILGRVIWACQKFL